MSDRWLADLQSLHPAFERLADKFAQQPVCIMLEAVAPASAESNRDEWWECHRIHDAHVYPLQLNSQQPYRDPQIRWADGNLPVLCEWPLLDVWDSVIPFDGSVEAEIAQWGSIRTTHVYGDDSATKRFMALAKQAGRCIRSAPEGSIPQIPMPTFTQTMGGGRGDEILWLWSMFDLAWSKTTVRLQAPKQVQIDVGEVLLDELEHFATRGRVTEPPKWYFAVLPDLFDASVAALDAIEVGLADSARSETQSAERTSPTGGIDHTSMSQVVEEAVQRVLATSAAAEPKKEKARSGKETTKKARAKKAMIDMLEKGTLPSTLRKASAVLKPKFSYSTVRDAAHESRALQSHFKLNESNSTSNSTLLDELSGTLARQFQRLPAEAQAKLEEQHRGGETEKAMEILKTLSQNPDAGSAGDVSLIEATDQDSRDSGEDGG